MVSFHQLLKLTIEKGASDLHITVGIPPQLRINGSLIPLDMPPLKSADTKNLIYSILTDAQKHRFEENWELDFSFGVEGLSRFRANVFLQRGSMAAAIRTIPNRILSFQELGLPPGVAELADKPRGLILVTGPTGSGKSTTLAALIDKVNNEKPCHIVTIEDPIEFVHQHRRAIVNQRELDADTKSFPNALKYILRQDPDVVLIGEMRDLETITSALTIAETGHLAFATLHTNSCVQTINRIVDVFSLLPAAPGSRSTFFRPGRRAVAATYPQSGRKGKGRRPGNHDAQSGHPKPDSRGQDPSNLFPDAGRAIEIRYAKR